MTNSLLPPDLRRQVDTRQVAHRGVGGAARENAAQSAVRAQAFGETAAAAADEPVETEGKPEAAIEKCPGCRASLDNEWNYCAKCGRDLVSDRDPIMWLGIKSFVGDDVEEWLFKGYIVRDLPIVGDHKIRVKSSQARDLKEVDAYFLSGEYKDKPLSQDLYKQLHTMATVATSVFSLDGKSIGDKLSDKMTWLEERGSAFVDMVTYRVAVFNRAWTRYAEAQNRLMGS